MGIAMNQDNSYAEQRLNVALNRFWARLFGLKVVTIDIDGEARVTRLKRTKDKKHIIVKKINGWAFADEFGNVKNSYVSTWHYML